MQESVQCRSGPADALVFGSAGVRVLIDSANFLQQADVERKD